MLVRSPKPSIIYPKSLQGLSPVKTKQRISIKEKIEPLQGIKSIVGG